jgi:RNA polymerase sigma-70 factor (ECF subfamily)
LNRQEALPCKERALEFEDFCKGEYAAVFRAACLATGSTEVAADATQEAFQRAFARWPRLSQHAWAGGWVTTTALNLCRREMRRAARPVAAVAHRREERDVPGSLDVVAALGTLPFRQRQAVVLFYWSDLPVAAIAELMDISESAVRSHLTHARSALKPTLEVHHA